MTPFLPKSGEEVYSIVSRTVSKDGTFLSAPMIQIYADWLVQLMDNLRELETRAKRWSETGSNTDTPDEIIGRLIKDIELNVNYLDLRSAKKQLLRLYERVREKCSFVEFASLIEQLHVRIVEDLEDRVFYCINDPHKLETFFSKEYSQKPRSFIRMKSPNEVFDSEIIVRFPDATDDLKQAILCYVASCYTAAVFHLMRVVEQGVMEMARMADIKDPKASWGAVLAKVDKYCFQTKYEDLPDRVKPHRELLKTLIPEMHAIQHAWRNRVSHIENKLIPTDPIDQTIAREIFTTVEVFMRSLVKRLPPTSSASPDSPSSG
jgi:hypothetical protein